MGFYSFFGVTTPFDPQYTLVTSNILPTLGLGLFRLIVAVYTLTAILTIVIWERVVEHDLEQYLTYFTNLTYIGMCAYFWASSLHTITFGLRLRRKSSTTPYYPLQRWPKFLQLLHVFLTCTVYVFPFIVTIVFWALLASGAFDTTWDTWKNISVHALNSAIALTEILLSRAVPRWSNIPILVLVLAGYLGVAYITHATQGYYTYGFLDPKKGAGKLAAYIVGIPVAAILLLCIVKAVCWGRDKLLGRFRPQPSTAEDEFGLQEKPATHNNYV